MHRWPFTVDNTESKYRLCIRHAHRSVSIFHKHSYFIRGRSASYIVPVYRFSSYSLRAGNRVKYIYIGPRVAKQERHKPFECEKCSSLRNLARIFGENAIQVKVWWESGLRVKNWNTGKVTVAGSYRTRGVDKLQSGVCTDNAQPHTACVWMTLRKIQFGFPSEEISSGRKSNDEIKETCGRILLRLYI